MTVTAFGKELEPKGKPASSGMLGGISNFFKRITGGKSNDGPRSCHANQPSVLWPACLPADVRWLNTVFLFAPARRCPPSLADPSNLTGQPIASEDDVLFVRDLPLFDNRINERDSELLISYLTAPYIRHGALTFWKGLAASPYGRSHMLNTLFSTGSLWCCNSLPTRRGLQPSTTRPCR